MQTCPDSGSCLDGRWEKEQLRCAYCGKGRESQATAADQAFRSVELAVKNQSGSVASSVQVALDWHMTEEVMDSIFCGSALIVVTGGRRQKERA